MSRPLPTDEEMDAMFGHPAEPFDPSEAHDMLSERLNDLDLKLDRLLHEVRVVGVAILAVAAMLYFKWPS